VSSRASTTSARELTQLYVDHGVRTINFILFNPIVEQDAKREHLNVEYSKARARAKARHRSLRSAHREIDGPLHPALSDAGYEQYVTNMPQIQYDSDEWTTSSAADPPKARS